MLQVLYVNKEIYNLIGSREGEGEGGETYSTTFANPAIWEAPACIQKGGMGSR